MAFSTSGTGGVQTQNQDSLEKVITTQDLAPGGVMPRVMFEEFFQEVQESATLLNMIRTEEVANEKTRLPKIGVAERLRRSQAENTSIEEVGVNTGYVDMDCEKGAVYWSLTTEDIENNPEGEELADIVLSLMSQQFSVDTQDLAINGDVTADDGTAPTDDQLFLGQNDGFFQVAADEGMPTYDHANAAIGTNLFNEMILSLDDRYLERTNPVFMISRKQMQRFRNDLAGTESDAAFMMIMGSDELTPFDFDIVAPSSWPEGKAMFTDPQNLIYALFREVVVDTVQNTDLTHENDLYARYAIHAKDDFAIEDADAGVVANNIATT